MRSFLIDGAQAETGAIPVEAVTGDVDIASTSSFAFASTADSELLVPIASSSSFEFASTATLEAVNALFYIAYSPPSFVPLSAAFPHDIEQPFPPFTPPTPPTPPVITRSLASDTIRGGADIVIRGDSAFITTANDQPLISLTLPTGWASLVSGGTVTPTRDGLVLDTTALAGATAGLRSVATFQRFDVAVDVEFMLPVEAVQTAVDLAVLEVASASGGTARVRIRRGVGADLSLLVAAGDMTLSTGAQVSGTLAAVTPAPLTLRIVRNASRLFGFVGRRDAAGRYTELVKVLEGAFDADAGTVTLRVANNLLAGRIQTRFTNLTFRPNVTIDGKLLDDQVTYGRQRIFGHVPATTQERLGLRDIVVFGDFGEVVNAASFEYTLPPKLTIGRERTRTLFTVQDPILRDGT